MNRETWYIIRNSKSFNVNVYRRGLVALIISLLLSTILGVCIFYKYVSKPERDYYATSGETPPVKLKSMSTPNMSSTALLDPDPQSGVEDKEIPQ